MIAALTLKRNVLAVEEDDWNILGTKSRVLETLAGDPVDAKLITKKILMEINIDTTAPYVYDVVLNVVFHQKDYHALTKPYKILNSIRRLK